MSKFKVIGITSGIGSLQYGFKRAGFEVGHSHEWRKYYNTGTYKKNYGKDVWEEYEPDRNSKGVDCIVSHPECGNFSNLYTGKNAGTRQADPGDIYQFIDLAKGYQPKTFLVDNLPKSLIAVSKEAWKSQFPDYNIYFEYISNWGYGNVQKNRNRLFIIGVHKDLDWQFVPQEQKHEFKMYHALMDIEDNAPNHQKMQLDDMTQWSGYQIGKPSEGRLKLKEIQYWLGAAKMNANLPYYNKAGQLKNKPGYCVLDTERHAPVLSGGGGFYDNHWVLDDDQHYYRPLTMRERLRIQGFSDDFILDPITYEYGTKGHQSLIKQTGKCMPVQFPYFFAKQLMDYLSNGIKPDHAPSRLLKQI